MSEHRMSESAPDEAESDGELFRRVREFYDPVKARYGDVAAQYYENRGQIEQALAEWSTAAALGDIAIDSKYCQSMLKSVNASDCDRLEAQIRWAKTHAISLDDDDSVRFQPYDGCRKITIGYHCCWWDSSTIRGQGIPFIANHDRFKFRIIGYSLGACDRSITQHFDEFVDVTNLTHEEFARRVRSDKVDVFIEFTGFSPFHRFAAMGARCAPVQISYLNHAGTCGVPNVDYVLADEAAASPKLDQYYTEEVFRLPGTFFNFNYDWDEFPDAGPPPHLKNGVVTFGCFGSQSKINDAQIYIWAKLLISVANSRLFLRNMGLASAANREFMMRRFKQWGIHENRLRLDPGGDRYSILANYAEVDITLDTWPYNGGNTIAESVWAGRAGYNAKGRGLRFLLRRIAHTSFRLSGFDSRRRRPVYRNCSTSCGRQGSTQSPEEKTP